MTPTKNDFAIVKCSQCKSILEAKDFDMHKCDLPLTDVKRIPVIYFHDSSYGAKKLMTGWGVDGILYTFEVVPRKAIPCTLPLSDEFLQRKKSDKDFTEPMLELFIGG